MENQDKNFFYLFIDDDKFTNHINEKMINRVIKRPHYAIFHNPVEALLFINDFITTEEREIVLFLDLQIPYITGLEILQLLHKDNDLSNLNINIFILTSYEKDYYEQHFSSFKKVKGYINKPLSTEDIESVMNQVVI